MNSWKPYLLSTLIIGLLMVSVPITAIEKQNSSPTLHFQRNEVDQELTKIGGDQVIASVEDLLDSIIPYLESVKSQNGGWDLKSYSTRDEVYYGLAGGIAGIGMKLLDINQIQIAEISNDNKNLALSLAEELALYLNSTAISNETITYWTVGQENNSTDLGFDFGIAGISLFYARLANITQNSAYQDISLNGLDAIDMLANHTTGLHFNSSMYVDLESSPWYPTREMKYYSSESYTSSNTYYNGKSLGSLGIGHAALKIAQYLGISDWSTLPYKLVNGTDQWIQNQKVENGGEFSIPMSQPSFGLVATSKAYGSSGAIDFYLDLYEHSGNSSYLSEATGYFNFLNGTSSGQTKYQQSLIINGSLTESTTLHLGLGHGIAGIIDSLDYYLNVTETTTFDDDMVGLIYYLSNFQVDDGDYVKYPERTEGTSKRNLGSLSYSTGSGGILPLLVSMSETYGISDLSSDFSKAKAYVYTRISQIGNYSILSNLQTGIPENNPSIGYLSNYMLFFIESEGELAVSSSSLDFGTIDIGSSLSKSIVLNNLGDKPISVSWTDLSSSSIFVSGITNTIIEGRASYSLFISFIPTDETSYSESFTLVSGSGEEYTISLQGVASDQPIIELIDVPANNTEFTQARNVEYIVKVTDTSDIASVKLSINDTSNNMESTVDSDLFKYTWDMSNVVNGTYVVEIVAEDNIGNMEKIKLVYQVGINEPSLLDRFFSNTTLYWTIGLIITVSIASILITRKYRN